MPIHPDGPEGMLTTEQLAFYREKGYLVYGRLLDDPQLVELRELADSLYLDDAEHALELSTNTGSYALFLKVFQRAPRYRELVHQHPLLLDLLEAILGPVFRLVEDQLFYKPPHHGAPLAYHHDNIYYGYKDPEIVTCWIALDDATLENGCLQILPGSHREEVRHELIPETIIQEAVIDHSKLVPVPVKAGEIVIFDGLTIHGSGPNTTDFPRRVANMVAIAPSDDDESRNFSEEDNPYLRPTP